MPEPSGLQNRIEIPLSAAASGTVVDPKHHVSLLKEKSPEKDPFPLLCLCSNCNRMDTLPISPPSGAVARALV